MAISLTPPPQPRNVGSVNAGELKRRRGAGRPRAISRTMLEEAACELFLERGYPGTSVADITTRAGVSRATFFNYVTSKSDLLWAGVDDAIDDAAARLHPSGEPAAVGTHELVRLVVEVAGDLAPGVAVLAFANAEAMDIHDELRTTGAQRQARLAGIARKPLRIGGLGPLEADVWSRACAGAVFAALESWALETPGARAFAEPLKEAFRALGIEI